MKTNFFFNLNRFTVFEDIENTRPSHGIHSFFSTSRTKKITPHSSRVWTIGESAMGDEGFGKRKTKKWWLIFHRFLRPLGSCQNSIDRFFWLLSRRQREREKRGKLTITVGHCCVNGFLLMREAF